MAAPDRAANERYNHFAKSLSPLLFPLLSLFAAPFILLSGSIKVAPAKASRRKGASFLVHS